MATSPKLRNRRGQAVEEVSATEAKNAFGRVLERAERDGMVAISRHHQPRAVVLSIDEYRSLAQGVGEALAALRLEFDRQFEAMNARGQAAAMKRAFHTPPGELGRMAVKAARRRRG